MHGPKRASKIRKLFNLGKDDDVRKYVNTYRRTFTTKDGKKHSKAPKIQRYVCGGGGAFVGGAWV